MTALRETRLAYASFSFNQFPVQLIFKLDESFAQCGLRNVDLSCGL